jgi:ABC-2 type transport system permease protein
MIRQIIALALKELNVLWHDREALALLFLMPVFFILLMSLALEGVFETGTSARPLKILVVNEDRGRTAQETIDALGKVEGIELVRTWEGGPLTLEQARDRIARQEFGLALHFRRHMSEQIKAGRARTGHSDPGLVLIVDPTLNYHLLSSLKGTIQGVVERQALLYRLPQLIANRAAALEENSGLDTTVVMDTTPSQITDLVSHLSVEILDQPGAVISIIPLQAGQRAQRPTSTEQNVPGYTIFGVFFIVLTLASSFIKEKNDGTFQRILTAPLSKTALLVGKLLPYYLVNLIQIVLMFAVGVIIFDLYLGSIAGLLLVSLALSAAANGLGLLVAALGRTEAQVNGLAVLLAIILSALGGMMVPVFVMPGCMQTLAQFTPHAWALAGYHDVMIRGLGVRDVLGEAGVLLIFAGLFFLVAWWRFRFD